MGHIMSGKAKGLENIDFVGVGNGKSRKAKRVIGMGERNFLVELENGDMICGVLSGGYDKNYAFLPTRSWLEFTLIKTLEKIGYLEKGSAKKHEDHITALELERSKKWRLETMQECAKEYGFKLTKSQLQKLQPKEKK